MRPPDGAFRALLVLVSGVSAVIVPPPTNVTVSCQNQNVTVIWEYVHWRPGTSFTVDVRGAAGRSVSETAERRCDLTSFVWASEARYMDNFYVTVTAALGSNRSEPAQSKTFTFNDAKTADMTCQLDFPPVILTAGDSGPAVSVDNPFLFYKELKKAVKSQTASFVFDVASDGGRRRFTCTAEEQKCRGDVVFPDGAEECVTLDGRLFEGNGVGQVLFRKTGRVCTSPTDMTWLWISLPVVVAISVVLIIIFVSWKKIWTPMETREPKCLRPDFKVRRPEYDSVSQMDGSTVQVCGWSHAEKEEEEEEEEEEELPSANSSAGLYVERGLSGSSDPDLGVSPSTSEDWMDSEEEERSPYDCPHALQLDMGDGENVTGYRKS